MIGENDIEIFLNPGTVEVYIVYLLDIHLILS